MTLVRTPVEAGLMIQSYLQGTLPTIGVSPENVYYGDRKTFAVLPAVAIEVADMHYNVRPPSYTADIPLAAYIMVYYGRMGDQEASRQAADTFGQQIVDLLNADPQWKDSLGAQRLIYGWVTRQEPGYAKRGENLYATRITWEALTKSPLIV